MTTAITATAIQPVVNLAVNAVTSSHTKRAYSRALTDFIAWYRIHGAQGLTKATVQAHIAHLRASGVPASSINQRLTAIRKLALECADNSLIDHATAQAICRVEGVRTEGKRLGNWLSRDQAQALLQLPDVATNKGIRDRAILAVLLGCGLRREECAGLTVEHIQQREGRWVVVDLVGKRSKLRSVPVPGWTKAAMDAWLQRAGIDRGLVFRRMYGGTVGISAATIFGVVSDYARQLRVDARPHDLRRTFAQLAYKGGAPLEQIQLSLGHASIQTTERYLGIGQDLVNAPGDVLGLSL
jgi:integrase/recombinase XerD